MDKIKKAGLYITCILCGIYTADMIYRIIRYVSAFADGDVFSKTIVFTGTVFVDSGTFMILSAACAACIAVSAFCFGILKKTTAVAFIVNFISALVFILSACTDNISLEAVMYIFVFTVPLYMISGLWCIYFCIRDLCKYFLNNTDEEINK